MTNKEYKDSGVFQDVKIGSVASLFGLSDVAIRKYEQSGLVFPSHLPNSKYRSYDTMDLVMLLYSRAHKEFGFTVKETGRLANDYDVENIKDAYEKQIQHQKHKIDLLKNELDFMEEITKDIERIPELLDKCELSTSPGIFRIDFACGGELLIDPSRFALLKKWIGYAPFTFISTVYERSILEQQILLSKNYGDKSIRGGFGILEQYANLFPIRKNDIVQYCPPIHCVHTITYGNNQKLYPDLAPVYTFMKNNRIHPAGDAISFGIVCYHYTTIFERYCHLWIPYEKD
ncbi:MAG: MerR family transcriptional regulator [Clostridia bacterium]|nr:MerR family transcriptional regulator [Clostridia bacterium]